MAAADWQVEADAAHDETTAEIDPVRLEELAESIAAGRDWGMFQRLAALLARRFVSGDNPEMWIDVLACLAHKTEGRFASDFARRWGVSRQAWRY